MRLTVLSAFSCAVALAQTPFDIVIAGGQVIDGSGNPWFVGDVGIRGNTIAAVGALSGQPSRVRLDAKGLVVTPGFVDTHSHGRQGIFEVPGAPNQLHQGVTTIIEGPDGSSPLPIRGFLEKVAAAPPSVNFGLMAGHGTIREAVIGLANRPPTPEELGRMRDLMRQAMIEGAFGISTGLFYVPGTFARVEEVIELAKIAGSLGGVHTSHMRDEAAGILDSVRETIRIGEEGGLPTQLTHHKIIGKPNWGKSTDTIRLVEEARARGVDVTIDQYPYTASSTGIQALLPQWSLEGGRKAMLERLEAPETRARIKTEIVRRIIVDRGGGDPKNIALASCAFDKTLAGKNLAEVTAARGRAVTPENAAETTIELVNQGGCSAIYHAISEDDLERILRYPFTMIASDGGIPVFGGDVPHPRNYGTFARILGRYVRERRVLTLEDAVRRMTSLPASRFRLYDRGLLKPGLKADVAVFDPATVADKAEFGQPHRYAAGFRHVLVNGRIALRDGQVTGERPGHVLYGPAHQTR